VVAGVAKVRAEAARAGCSNNLREIAMALHNYDGNFHSFPAATVAREGLPPERRLSWLVEVPSSHTQIALALHRDEPWDSDQNREPKIDAWWHEPGEPAEPPFGQWELFLCPSNPNRPAGPLGLTHYVGVAGLGPEAAALPAGYPGIGVFGYARRTRVEDIKDGTSTTLLVIETARDNGPWTAGGWPTVRGLDPAEPPYLGQGRQFGGTHSGGTVAAFADGSAKFIRNSISPRILEALATIAGGEEVGEAISW
jgi:hypothetical protein